jgi:hypothetical protein
MTEILDEAIIDCYVRKNKSSRDYPRKKQEQAAGPPVLLNASRGTLPYRRPLRHLPRAGNGHAPIELSPGRGERQ